MALHVPPWFLLILVVYWFCFLCFCLGFSFPPISAALWFVSGDVASRRLPPPCSVRELRGMAGSLPFPPSRPPWWAWGIGAGFSPCVGVVPLRHARGVPLAVTALALFFHSVRTRGRRRLQQLWAAVCRCAGGGLRLPQCLHCMTLGGVSFLRGWSATHIRHWLFASLSLGSTPITRLDTVGYHLLSIGKEDNIWASM